MGRVRPIDAATVPPIIRCAALAAAAYAWAEFVSTFFAPGAIGIDFSAPGSDWMVFYTAVRTILDGHEAVLFDGDRFTAALNAAMSGWLPAPLPYRPWINPPTFLLLLLPFGTLGFLGSYLAFELLSAAALALALWGITRPRDGTLAIATALAPAAAITVVEGQSAMLVAALLIGGFRLARTRAVLGGLLLGLLTFKPQFWLLVPLALLASRQWRCLSAASGCAGLLVIASAAAFGTHHWIWWLGQSTASFLNPDSKWVEYGRMWGNSVFTCTVLLGLPTRAAGLVQAAALVGSAAAVIRVFALPASPNRRLAVLLTATILSAPHSGFYDALLLVPAAGLWLSEDPEAGTALRPWIVGLGLWLVPLVTPPALVPVGRLLPLFLAAFLWHLVRPAARSARARSARRSTGLAPVQGLGLGREAPVGPLQHQRGPQLGRSPAALDG